MNTLAARLANTIQAIRNCRQSGNKEWLDKHTETLKELMQGLPSGAGFDNGTKLDEPACNAMALRFNTSFHHMNEHGYYDGWTDHTVTVRPTFDGLAITVSGVNCNDVKDIIADAFHVVLTAMEDQHHEHPHTT